MRNSCPLNGSHSTAIELAEVNLSDKVVELIVDKLQITNLGSRLDLPLAQFATTKPRPDVMANLCLQQRYLEAVAAGFPPKL